MSKVSSKKRKQTIKLQHKRRQKLAKLRQAYVAAKSKEKKDKIWTKVNKISPRLSQEEFLRQKKS